MTAWIVIGAVALGSYAMRALFLVVAQRPLPAAVTASLRFVGPSALAALLTTMTLTSSGEVDPLPAGELAAVVAAFIAVRRTGKVFAAFAVGLPVVWATAALGL